jgi:diacylglycerol kinase (ATP)
MPDTLFIINPTSARGTTLNRWQAVRKELVTAGISFAERHTTHPGDALETTTTAIKTGIKRIIAVGGDGTLNDVLNGYLDAGGAAIDRDAAIGLVPSGTGSDFRRSIGLLKKADSIRALTESQTRLIDAMKVEFENQNGEKISRHSMNVVSFGLGGEVTTYVNNWRETLPNWIGGKARFVAAAVLALKQFKNKNVRVTIDDRPALAIQSNLIVVGNGRFAGGGMMLAPKAELDDGLLDVILTSSATRFDVIGELRRIYVGGLLKNPKVSLYRARTVAIDSGEKLAIDIDGETVGFTPARVSILPLAVQFIANRPGA